MKINNFLKVGVITVLTMAIVSNVLAQPIKSFQEKDKLDNTEIVQIVKQNISKKDLIYLVQSGLDTKNEKADLIYNKIKNSIENKYSSKFLNQIEKELNNTFKNMHLYENINIKYSYAIPKQIINEVKGNSNNNNDSSVAYGAMSISDDCEVNIKLAVDNNGRLFESSELTASNIEEISQMSNEKIKSILQETIYHEASHCILHDQMKNSDWKLKFSENFKNKYPEIAKSLNEKINESKIKIANKDYNLDHLDKLMFTNLHENFSDVMSSFVKLGNSPTEEKIKEAKEQLINISKFREKSDIYHSTQIAVQNALEKIDYAATLNIEQRKDLALEIASESLLFNIKTVFHSIFGQSDEGLIATFLINGTKLNKDGTLNQEVSKEKEEVYMNIGDEVFSIINEGNKYGSINKKLLSHKELEEKYLNKDKKEDKQYTFNQQNFLTLRNKYLVNNNDNNFKYKS